MMCALRTMGQSGRITTTFRGSILSGNCYIGFRTTILCTATLDGMRDYGAPELLIHPLTVMEYQRFRPFVPLATRAWWTATGWTTASSPYSNTNYAYRILTDGTVGSNGVCYAYFAPRPALYLQSKILVSIDTEDQEKGLKDYPSVELLDELRRRES